MEQRLSYLIYLNPYIFHITLYEAVSLGTIFTGLTLALLLGLAKRAGQKGNLFLSLALAVIVLKVGGLIPFLLPALGPLLYFYVRQLTSPDRDFHWKNMLHFCPLLIGYWMPVWLVLIPAIIYLYLSHLLIEAFYNRLHPVLMDRPRFAFRRLDRVLILLGLFCAFWLFYEIFSFGVAFVLIGMAGETILKPDSNAELTMPITDRSNEREKGRRLKEAVAVNRLFEDAELTLTTLALKLNIHPHDLSRIINTGLGKNFNDFINEFRVREIARKMQDPVYDRFTLLGIAYESGFNSQRTFNRVFKEMTGKTPVDYKNSLKKELPNDKLASLPRLRPVILHHDSIPRWSHEQINRTVMFKNYFKIAFRNFWKYKAFTLINVVGLSIGISAALVIYLIVHYDFTFDKFHKDGDRIYRVVSNFKFQGNENHSYGVTGPMAAGIKNNVTGVELIAPLFTINPDVTVTGKHNEPIKFKGQDHITLADQNYFKLIHYTWLAGTPATALNEPYHVVLTAERAKVYFPSLTYEQIIGKTVTYDTLKTTVSGIVESIKENTDFSCHDFISFSSGKPKTRLGMDMNLTDWGSTNSASEVFIKLYPKVSAANVQKQINAMYRKKDPHSADDIKNGRPRSFTVQPLSDIHFNRIYGTFDFSGPANETRSYLLLVVAGFLLLLGCINFINLTTAQATQRAKEIGIRKTLGSNRGQLIVQFLSETFLITLFAVIISIASTPLILKLFADFIASGVKADFIHQPDIFLFLFGLIIVVSFLSGFYPALLLSGYKPVLVLKNQVQSDSHKTRNAWLRKSLTVSQFVVAQFFIMATLLVSKQIYYILHKDLGFKKDAIVYAETPYKVRKSATNEVMANKLRALPGVAMVSVGFEPPSSGGTTSTTMVYKDGKKEITTPVELKFADENYIRLYHIKILAGRGIETGDTSKAFVINEKYARILGFTNSNDAVGKVFTWNEKNLRIVGVVADFYTHSLQSPVSPLAILAPGNDDFHNGIIHIALKPETTGGGEWQKTMTAMQKIWKQMYPDDEPSYKFYDKSIAEFYNQEQSTSTLLGWATGLSILISCLGLLGLAIYTTGQRTKEIGVRKVLGASVVQIVRLLSKELVLLILLAFAIVTPLAWLAMNKWMENYVDKTPISWWIFAASGAGMLLVAFITSSFQTIKAAVANPVKSLRSE